MLKRIIKGGWMNFRRGGLVTAATIMVMTLTLVVVEGLVLFTVVANTLLAQVAEKVDISVYFKTTIPEEEILGIKKEVANLSDVANVEYVSREAALLEFKDRNKGNALLEQALEELGENPLEASLNIRAKDPRQYASIARFMESGRYQEAISKVNYAENQKVIDRLANILAFGKRLGVGVSATLAFISILVAFNTIRLAIYHSKEEIGIQKLVGATNSFVRGPFLVEGLLHGTIAAALTLLIFLPITAWLGPKFSGFFGGFNLFNYLLANFFQTLLILIAVGMMLGVISSAAAVRRYLRV